MDILRAAVAENDKDANTWVATDYWTHYGSKIGTSDLFYREPIHVVLASYLENYDGPKGDAGKGYFRLEDVGPGGITVREFYGDGTLFCEHRIYLIVKEKE
jgi:hypothetical protein